MRHTELFWASAGLFVLSLIAFVVSSCMTGGDSFSMWLGGWFLNIAGWCTFGLGLHDRFG